MTAPDPREEALRMAREYVERARLNLSFAKQDAAPSKAAAESNINSAFHDCVAALAALDAIPTSPVTRPPDEELVEAMLVATNDAANEDEDDPAAAMRAALSVVAPYLVGRV